MMRALSIAFMALVVVLSGSVAQAQNVQGLWRATSLRGQPVSAEENARLHFRVARVDAMVGCHAFYGVTQLWQGRIWFAPVTENYSSCSDRDRELFNALKGIVRDANDWRVTGTTLELLRDETVVFTGISQPYP
jgi:heat shock protein HslJ